jgi:hypothetical protein
VRWGGTQHQNARTLGGVYEEIVMDDETVAALLAAGRLLQSRQWFWGKREIKRQAGETYPQAVLRVIKTLPDDERAKLRELTEWVRAYEKADELYK